MPYPEQWHVGELRRWVQVNGQWWMTAINIHQTAGHDTWVAVVGRSPRQDPITLGVFNSALQTQAACDTYAARPCDLCLGNSCDACDPAPDGLAERIVATLDATLGRS